MQSPHKLQARLSELMGPPGPDADPMELTLRSIVAMTGPAIMNIVSQMTPEALDEALEDVAVWFLALRSDGAQFTLRFARALGELEAGQVPEIPVLTAGPDPQPAPAQAPAPAPDPAAPAPDPSSGGAPATDASPSSSTPTAAQTPSSVSPADPAPGSGAPSTDAPPSSASTSDTAAAADPASGTPASEQPPAPPWG